MWIHALTLPIAALIAIAPAAAAAPCRIEAAHFTLRGDPGVTARFHLIPRGSEDWPWGVALEIRIAASGRSSWWLPTSPGTSGNQGFRWTALKGSPEAAPGYRHRLPDLRYFAFDAAYGIIDDVAKRGDVAPQHMLLDNLREAFWYSDVIATRYAPAKSLFDLTGCADEAAEFSARRPPDLVFPPVP